MTSDDWFPEPQAALSPLYPLYARYRADRNDRLPDQLSRHALVHSISLGHLNVGHAMVAIMLLVSLLRELEERYAEIRHDMGHFDDAEA
ncbi:hypothetical protein [Actinacidiphila oryziradicis]|uniref:Uncharacterized protein n=1 Tax=Actinacidiphila oryziradicis TaxID=2571141 RepID=A0A4U0SPF6_9ACTN|nr:hypothetical protein [Actinacidiphila oryziradicis]TKA11802.1 hypothetical protein FCI23_10840 [Actinacidiphila oryziradicis]